jgi:predicted transcriptional regulator
MPLRAADVMQRNVITVTPATPLAELARKLIARRVGGVAVVERGAVVGIVSRSDLIRARVLERSVEGLVAEGLEQAEFAPGGEPEPLASLDETSAAALEGRTVGDIMVPDPVTVAPETPIAEVARLLVTRHIHRVLVIEGTALRGIISALDMVRLIGDGRLREA